MEFYMKFFAEFLAPTLGQYSSVFTGTPVSLYL